MQASKHHRRQDLSTNNTANSLRPVNPEITGNTTVVEETSLDMLLMYLARLQNKVIDCIRYVASTIPTDNTVPPTEESVKSTAPERRQLIIPDVYDPEFEDIFDAITDLGNYGDQAGNDASIPSDTRSQSDDPPPIALSPSTSTDLAPSPAADSDAVDILPHFRGPGPVVPPGTNFTWPVPFRPGSNPDNVEDMPQVTNDIDPIPGSATSNKDTGDGKDWAGIEDDEGKHNAGIEGVKEMADDIEPENGGERKDDVRDEGLWSGYGDGKDNLEDMPALTDDLGPGEEEEEVRKRFEEETANQAAALASEDGAGDK